MMLKLHLRTIEWKFCHDSELFKFEHGKNGTSDGTHTNVPWCVICRGDKNVGKWTQALRKKKFLDEHNTYRNCNNSLFGMTYETLNYRKICHWSNIRNNTNATYYTKNRNCHGLDNISVMSPTIKLAWCI